MLETRSSQSSPWRLSLAACLDTLPLAIAVIPWGILTGALAVQVGMSPLQAQLLSLLTFAGAAQLSCLTLMGAGASLSAIFGSTFVISSRHLLYSVVFREHVLALPQRWRLAIAFVLTDEMFAVSQAHTHKTGQFSALYALVSGYCFYVVWNLATLAGIIAGDLIQNLDSLGLDFAIAATFIAMTFGELRRFPIVIAVVVSGFLSVALKAYFSDSYIIIAALIGMAMAYSVKEEASNKSSDKRGQKT